MKTEHSNSKGLKLVSLFCGIIVFTIGALNLWLVHAVPGTIFLLFSLLYLPIADTMLKRKFGFSVPSGIKIASGVVIIWFTFGVSDLGDIVDNLAVR